jgi:hypothetical protein
MANLWQHRIRPPQCKGFGATVAISDAKVNLQAVANQLILDDSVEIGTQQHW